MSNVKSQMLAVLSGAAITIFMASTPHAQEDEPPLPSEPPVSAQFYDTDRNMILEDTDGDGVPDLTESFGETDPNDPASYPGADTEELEQQIEEQFTAEMAGFPAETCRFGYRTAGPRLCISTNVQNASRYDFAQRRCRVQRGRMASYEDLYYLYIHTALDASFNPAGKWIGNMVGDDRALCGNRWITMDNDPDQYNFETVCNKSDDRSYWCAHDRF